MAATCICLSAPPAYALIFPNPLKTMRTLKLISLFAFSCILLAAGAIVVTGLNDEIADADVIIVPGNTVAPDGTPSPRLRARLDVAVSLFHDHRAPIIFVSGGEGREGFDEAVAMFDYLSRNGVPLSAIVKDSLGADTAATARNAGSYMRANKPSSAIVATQYFHVARTKLALQRNGIHVANTAHARYMEWRDLYSIPREVVAYAAYYAGSKI